MDTNIPAKRACAGGRVRRGQALHVWIDEPTVARLASIKQLASGLLGIEPAHSITIRLAVKTLYDQLQALMASAERQHAKHGGAVLGPDALRLKVDLQSVRGLVR